MASAPRRSRSPPENAAVCARSLSPAIAGDAWGRGRGAEAGRGRGRGQRCSRLDSCDCARIREVVASGKVGSTAAGGRARRSAPAKRSEGEHFSVSRHARWDATGRTRNAVAATAATAVSWTPTASTRSCSRCSAAARTRTHRRPRVGAPWPASLLETEALPDILCPIQVVRLVRGASSALTVCGRIARDIIASEV